MSAWHPMHHDSSRCHICDYDFTGRIDPARPCPECGTTPPPPPPPPEPPPERPPPPPAPDLLSRLTQYAFIAMVIIASQMLLWPYSTVHTSYRARVVIERFGVLHWKTERTGWTNGTTINELPLALNVVITGILIIWALRAIPRIHGNTRARDRCNYCGANMPDLGTRVNVCNECGELPNEKRNPWFFGR